jgi:FMN phosphatase YigB (HAD superfamily)
LRHEEAINHVNLALELLDKKEYGREDSSEEGKSYWNIKMLCFYNKAIEEEHLKYYEQSLASYQAAKEIAKVHGSKNVGIVLNCDEAVARI